MNYRKVYLKIIHNAKLENRNRNRKDQYYEAHHILPKSLFPLWSKRKSNLVLLTAREHYFCHQLLNKIYPNEKMFLALWFMTIDKKHLLNSKEYERLRIKISELKKGKPRSKEVTKKILQTKLKNNSTTIGKHIRDFYSEKAIANFYNGQKKKIGKFIQITNGKENKMISKKLSIPSGFWRGYTYLSSGSIPIKCLENGKTYDSIQKASIELKITRASIKKILAKKIKEPRLHFVRI